ncbi:DUF58 domain-containing protein [Rhodopirellula sp. JC740]|uniref:DUF58 domain-containing protein n=1 Tax=Rhodopirellula halodulae TaxID=2894198 RepID=A0ABS8NGH6_9BACT|nr:DUF58 domain-containing protein [Rhodopirellula sp. JC740]MCC9642657.1 DUF58 domain-containing protein [Rhodopirellula sp. JC740]
MAQSKRELTAEAAALKRRRSMRRLFLKTLRWCNPIGWWLSLRRSLTGGSVTLLLIGIISMNIVWGYPWMGMFASCFAMFVVGWAINRVMTPRLKVAMDLPIAVRAGDPLMTRVNLLHQGRLPAMNLYAGLDPNRDAAGRATIELDQHKIRMLSIPEMEPRGSAYFDQVLTFVRRGVQSMPAVRVESLFPFHLFRSTQWIASDETVVVTPRRMDFENDMAWRAIQANLRGLAVGLAQGDHQHYVGSREYRVGMSVRRWDFASWARLGKPILREFNSAAKQTVTVFVDTSPNEEAVPLPQSFRWRRVTEDEDISLERLLSIASAGLETLVGANVQVQLVVPWNAPSVLHKQEQSGDLQIVLCEGAADPIPLLMALAEAQPIDASKADEILNALPHPGGTFHGVVFSRRDRETVNGSNMPDLMWINVEDFTEEWFGNDPAGASTENHTDNPSETREGAMA